MPDQYHIRGGQPLRGHVTLAGAKNAAGKFILASLLSPEPSQLTNVPKSGESRIALEIAQAAGASVSWKGNRLNISPSHIATSDLSQLEAKNRHSFLAIGPLLHRTGTAIVPKMGGDQIGARPVDFHINALQALGAHVEQTESGYVAHADTLNGATINLPYPSVGATETVLLSASWAKGATKLRNAAIEPEIIQLAEFLNAMGAMIRIDETQRTMHIQGVPRFHGGTIDVLPDRIEAVSYIAAALATRGDIIVKRAQATYLGSYLDFLDRIDASWEEDSEGIRVWTTHELRPTTVTTAVHPGFMTDWQQPSAVLLCTVPGRSVIHETVWENRLGYVNELVAMGAAIDRSQQCPDTPCRFADTYDHVATISGPTHWQPRSLQIPDIRAGMAHMIAALVTPGLSTLSGIEHLDRGYENLLEKLQGLGADIERTKG